MAPVGCAAGDIRVRMRPAAAFSKYRSENIATMIVRVIAPNRAGTKPIPAGARTHRQATV